MAKALKQVWTPIWNWPNPSKACRDDYLHRYNKRVAFQPPPFTLNMMRKAILRPREGAPGPDGIPFSVYRYLVDITAPLLLKYLKHLSANNKPNKSFNYANLFFLPKDDSHLPHAVRPITVVNTDNRLMANVVRMGITPALLTILHKAQKAFVPGDPGRILKAW